LEVSKSRFTEGYYKNVQTYLKVFVRWIGGSRRVDRIRRQDIAKFKEHLVARKKRKLTSTTVNHYLSALRQFFEWAEETGRVGENPVAFVKPAKGITRTRDRIVTPEEFTAILAGTKRLHARAALGLIRYCGMRNGEVFNLQWADIDEESGWIKVVHDPPERRTKSAKSRVTLLAEEVRPLLEAWKKIAPSSKWVFTNKDGVRIKNLYKSLGSAIASAGYTDITPYHLRHTFITAMIASGVDPVAVMQMAGHSGLRTTERYTHLRGEHVQAALERAGVVKVPPRGSPKAKKGGPRQPRHSRNSV